MSVRALAAFLKEISVFSGVSDARLEVVARRAHQHTLGVGKTLFEAGDFGSSLFVVIEGRLKVQGYLDVLQQDLGRGAVFGFGCVLGRRERLQTIVAQEETRLVEIGAKAIELASRDTDAGLVEALERAYAFRLAMAFMKRHPVLSTLEPTDLELLARSAKRQVHSPGQTIAEAWPRGEDPSLVLLISGNARICDDTQENPQVISYASPGQARRIRSRRPPPTLHRPRSRNAVVQSLEPLESGSILESMTLTESILISQYEPRLRGV